MRRYLSVRHFLNPCRFLDAFFAYARGGLADFRRVLREIALYRHAAPKKPSFLPQVELCEPRLMPSGTVSVYQLIDDAHNSATVPLGEASVDLNQGAIQLSQPLDFDISSGTDIGGVPLPEMLAVLAA